MAPLITSKVKVDNGLLTDFDAKGLKKGEPGYLNTNITIFPQALPNGDTELLNDKNTVLATIKKGPSRVLEFAPGTTVPPELQSRLNENKLLYVKTAAEKVKDITGATEDEVNDQFGYTTSSPLLSTNTGPVNTNPVTIAAVTLSDATRRSFKEILSYPATRNSKQDSVIFTIKKYGSVTLDPTKPTNIQRSNVSLRGTITLPIQPSISDSNNVQWGTDTLNPVQMVGAVSALNAALEKGKSAGDIGRDFVYGLGKSMEAFGGDENTRNAIMAYFAGEAVGNQNLLSRINGSVLNPNLELLFQGPQLRNFNFNFQLTPRSKDDVTQVRKIIRTFKQAMAVQRSKTELFLSAPFVFGIKYVFSSNTNDPHPYLPRIHDCALTNFSVDYTPDGSYMTYVDGSMTSYRLTMQFQELTPIYNDQYENKDDDTDKDTNIGY